MVIIAFSIFIIPASAEYKPAFKVRGRNAILYNVDTDTVLYTKNPDEKTYPASLTKIMVAVLLVEKNKNLKDLTVTISNNVYEEYKYSEAVIAGFDAGQKVNGHDLLAYTLVKSCADASAAIAEYVAGSEAAFIEMMNDKAKELGMTSTNFTNCHGLHDPNHYSTARDMCILTKYAMQYSVIKDIVEVARYETKDGITLAATNLMIDPNSGYYYKYATGFKTGFTDEAGRCLASTASYEGMTYILIMLGCPAVEGSVENRYEFIDSAELYRWAFLGFSYVSILDKSEVVDSIPVEYSWDYDSVNVRPHKDLYALMPNEADKSTLNMKVKYKNDKLEAPVKKGQVVGTIEMYYADQLVGIVDCVAAESIEGSSILKTVRSVSDFFRRNKKVIAAILLIIVAIVIIFVIAVIRLNSKKKKYGRVRNYKRF